MALSGREVMQVGDTLVDPETGDVLSVVDAVEVPDG